MKYNYWKGRYHTFYVYNNKEYWWTTFNNKYHDLILHEQKKCKWYINFDNRTTPCGCEKLEIDPIMKLIWFQDITGGEYGI